MPDDLTWDVALNGGYKAKARTSALGQKPTLAAGSYLALYVFDNAPQLAS